MRKEEIIKRLRNDNEYFGEFGRQFFSNSDITRLRKDPTLYGKPFEETPFFLQGSLLHALVLEPNKAKDFKSIDCATRNNKEYRQALEDNGGRMLLLQKEVDEVNLLFDSIKSHPSIMSDLTGMRTHDDVEVPGLVDIFGHPFKGKADRINHFEETTFDLKMTFDYTYLRSRFRQYGYHTQAYIYQKIFGYPVVFIVASMKDLRVYKVEVSDATLAEAEADIMAALETYERYYGEQAVDDINDFILTDVI